MREIDSRFDIHQQELTTEDGLDSLTALESLTNYGRPDWDKIFTNVRDSHPATSTKEEREEELDACVVLTLSMLMLHTEVGVFLCGPRPLAKDLREKSMELSAKHKADGAKFVFNKENF